MRVLFIHKFKLSWIAYAREQLWPDLVDNGDGLVSKFRVRILQKSLLVLERYTTFKMLFCRIIKALQCCQDHREPFCHPKDKKNVIGSTPSKAEIKTLSFLLITRPVYWLILIMAQCLPNFLLYTKIKIRSLVDLVVTMVSWCHLLAVVLVFGATMGQDEVLINPGFEDGLNDWVCNVCTGELSNDAHTGSNSFKATGR